MNFKNFLEQTPKIIKNIKLNKSPLFQSYQIYSSQLIYMENISE